MRHTKKRPNLTLPTAEELERDRSTHVPLVALLPKAKKERTARLNEILDNLVKPRPITP